MVKGQVRQASVLNEHATAAAAFDEVERLRAQIVRTGAHGQAIELLVVNDEGRTLRPLDAP
jgi:hypothetical protein